MDFERWGLYKCKIIGQRIAPKLLVSLLNEHYDKPRDIIQCLLCVPQSP